MEEVSDIGLNLCLLVFKLYLCLAPIFEEEEKKWRIRRVSEITIEAPDTPGLRGMSHIRQSRDGFYRLPSPKGKNVDRCKLWARY